ncbi:MAG: hypothetical protein CMJ45_01245 [Planctomyces sp.]|nr:hypothetical protein [Planctomyces sp.]
MPDYQGRDENRIEFTPGGEGANYISLDQVLMLAFQHARNNREIYGKFADVELVWALDRAHETGDFYDVRLSYRPAHDFRGRPGVEQFIIPKSGGVEFRQIISEPRPIWWSPFVLSSVAAVLVAGIAIAVIFASGVLAPGLDPATAGQQVAVPLKPDVPARLTSSGVNVDVPAQAVGTDTRMTYRSLSASQIPVLLQSYRPSKAFDVSADGPLLKPVTITVDLSAADARLAESLEENIQIQHHFDGTWKQLDTKVDFGASTASTRVEHLSIFALTVKEPEPTDTIAPTNTSSQSSGASKSQGSVPVAASAEEAFQNGVMFYKQKQYELAAHQLTGAILLDPNVRNYYWYRGLANTGLSKFDEAIADFNAAIGLDPGSATLRALRGSACSKSGQAEMAFFDLDRAIALQPEHAMAHYTRGDAHTRIGQSAEAQVDYEKACQLDSQFCK